MPFTAEHRQISDTVKRFVRSEINPFVKQWEAAGQYPAHEVMKKGSSRNRVGEFWWFQPTCP